MDYTWDFSFLRQFGELWARGVYVTLLLSVAAIGAGTALGLFLVFGLSRQGTIAGALLRIPCRLYTDVFRSIPALVLMGTIYLCAPILIGVTPSPFQTAWIALALNLAPFAAEVVRAGIDSVPTVQYESARLIGFRGWRLAYYIIGPQAFRRILPPLVGQYVTTLKLSSLAATIGVVEIWNVTGQVVTATSRPVESRLVGAALYCLILLPSLWFVTRLEKRYEVVGLGEFAER